MSRNINVNPDHYKVAGRERQGEAVLQQAERQAYAQQRVAADRWHARPHEQAPGWETPAQPLGPGKPPARKRRRQARAKPRKASRRPTTASRRAASKRRVSKRAKRAAPKRGTASKRRTTRR